MQLLGKTVSPGDAAAIAPCRCYGGMGYSRHKPFSEHITATTAATALPRAVKRIQKRKVAGVPVRVHGAGKH